MIGWELVTWSQPKARKNHGCRDCGRTINPGETYHAGKGVYEGKWEAWAVCNQCTWVINVLVNNGADPEFMDVADEFYEFVSGMGNYRRAFHFTPGPTIVGTLDNPEVIAKWLKWARVYAYWRKQWSVGGQVIDTDTLKNLVEGVQL